MVECCLTDPVCPSCATDIEVWLDETPDALAAGDAKLRPGVCEPVTGYVAMARIASAEWPSMQFASPVSLWAVMDSRDSAALSCFSCIILPNMAIKLQQLAAETPGGWAAVVSGTRAFLERVECSGTKFVPGVEEYFRAIDKHQLHIACQARFGEPSSTLVGAGKGQKYSVEKLPAVLVCAEDLRDRDGDLQASIDELQPYTQQDKYVVKPMVGEVASGVSVLARGQVHAACRKLCASEMHGCACIVEPFNESLAQTEHRVFVLAKHACYMATTHSSAPGCSSCTPLQSGQVSLPWADPTQPAQSPQGQRASGRVHERQAGQPWQIVTQRGGDVMEQVVHNQEMRSRIDAAAERVVQAMQCAPFSASLTSLFARVDMALDVQLDESTGEVTKTVVLVNEIELFQRAFLFLHSPGCSQERCSDESQCVVAAKARLKVMLAQVIAYIKSISV